MNNETLNTIQSLRTIHWNFSEKHVSDEDLSLIIEHGMRAANSANLANYSVIVVDEEEKMKKLVGNSGNARCCIFCVDYTRIILSAKQLGYNYSPALGSYNILSDCYDVYAFAQTSVIAAKSMGIDSLITNGIFRVNMEEARKILCLPEKFCFPLIAVLFGYSDKPIHETTGRLNTKHVLHFDKYKQPNEPELNEFICEMDKIYPEYISERYPHTLDWYHNEWLFNSIGNEDKIPNEADIRVSSGLRNQGYRI